MSAKYGHGIEDVKEWILSKLPVGPAYYPKVCIQLSFAAVFIAMIEGINQASNYTKSCCIFLFSSINVGWDLKVLAQVMVLGP